MKLPVTLLAEPENSSFLVVIGDDRGDLYVMTCESFIELPRHMVNRATVVLVSTERVMVPVPNRKLYSDNTTTPMRYEHEEVWMRPYHVNLGGDHWILCCGFGPHSGRWIVAGEPVKVE